MGNQSMAAKYTDKHKEDVKETVDELKKKLDQLNLSLSTQSVKVCKKRYKELIKIAGELNDILEQRSK